MYSHALRQRIIGWRTVSFRSMKRIRRRAFQHDDNHLRHTQEKEDYRPRSVYEFTLVAS
jgi:hypothetical protein